MHALRAERDGVARGSAVVSFSAMAYGSGGGGEGRAPAGGNRPGGGGVKGPPAVGAISRSATVPPMACAWRAGVRLVAPAAYGAGTFGGDQEPGGCHAGKTSLG